MMTALNPSPTVNILFLTEATPSSVIERWLEQHEGPWGPDGTITIGALSCWLHARVLAAGPCFAEVRDRALILQADEGESVAIGWA